MGLVQKIFGTHSQHELKRIYPIADKVESYREEYGKLSDEQLKGKTKEFKERLSKGETLNDLLPEAYATVREAAKRVLGMEHYRVQIIGGIILHQGRIAEMRTGEGKTLVCTLPAYLNALEEKGVLVVTVNDYLAKRDAEWMGQVHNFLGLSVGIVLHDMKDDERRAAYASDITYVTNNELGFDYLRDNMAIYKEQLVLRDLHYCIIDEVDSVLIDEARTPLIISGQSGKSTKLYPAYDYQHGKFAFGGTQERQELYRRCEKEKVGITVMKALAGGQLLDAKLSPFGQALSKIQCIQYALDKPGVITVLPGFRNPDDLNEVLGYLNATKQERDYSVIGNFAPTDAAGRYVYCSHCHLCPKGLDIAMINKYYDLAKSGDALAKDHYRKLELHTGDGIRCGHCNNCCPFKITTQSYNTSTFHKKPYLVLSGSKGQRVLSCKYE